MIVKTGETRQEVLTSGTYNGIFLNVTLFAQLVNVQLNAADWNPATVQVKVILQREKQQHFVMNDNFQILGLFNTVLKGEFEFYNGMDYIFPGPAVKNVRQHMAFLYFGMPIRVNLGFVLITEVTIPTSGTFSTDCDLSLCNIEFTANPSIGYERGIPSTVSEVVQESSTKQTFNPGNLVTDLCLLNFDKNDFSTQVVQTLNVSSDRWNWNGNFNQVYLNHILQYGFVPNFRYGSVLPIAASDPTGRVFRGNDQYPQTFYLFGGKTAMGRQELNKCRVDISFNGTQVAASQNYLVYRRFITSKNLIRTSEIRAHKHAEENIKDVPHSLSGNMNTGAI
jgi:hypothetical protein